MVIIRNIAKTKYLISTYCKAYSCGGSKIVRLRARAQMDVPSMSDKELQAIVRKKLLGANVFQ